MVSELTRDGKVVSACTDTLTELGAKQSRPMKKGDVVIAVSGAPGLPAILAHDAYIHDGFVGLRDLNRNRLDPEFHYVYLTLIKATNNGQAVGAIFKNLTTDQIKGIEIPDLPLPEQRRIAEVLDRADALRAKRRAALAQLDELTQSIFLDMFGDPIKNPNGFPVRPMIELIDPQRPISYGILMPGPDQAEGVKYVRVTDMKNGGIELSGIRKTTETISNPFRRSLLKPGDLLMSIRGHVGRFAVIPLELDKANITQDSARLAIVEASSVFIRECLRADGFQRWMAKHTKGAAVRGINLGDVKLMPIILPPRKEQDNFARQANAAEQLKTSHRTSLTELDALFASLQHRAFRGDSDGRTTPWPTAFRNIARGIAPGS